MIVSLLGTTIDAYEKYLQALDIANMNSEEYFSLLSLSALSTQEGHNSWLTDSNLTESFVKLYHRSIIVTI